MYLAKAAVSQAYNQSQLLASSFSRIRILEPTMLAQYFEFGEYGYSSIKNQVGNSI